MFYKNVSDSSFGIFSINKRNVHTRSIQHQTPPGLADGWGADTHIICLTLVKSSAGTGLLFAPGVTLTHGQTFPAVGTYEVPRFGGAQPAGLLRG